MCGIVSILAKGADIAAACAERVERHLPAMLATLEQRGPDEQHTHRHGEAWLGHTRLSIIDLQTGSQPMFNEDGTVGTVFNGEIYNFQELRDELVARGHTFRTRSDTEVIVHLYEEHGAGLFARLNGMFAIALYDRRTQTFLVGRDRTGEKPLLYRETDEHIFVASELKALLRWPDTPREMDPDAVALYLNFMCVPAPATMFRCVRKLMPGHYLQHRAGHTVIEPYWEPGQRIDWSMTEAQAVEEFDALFTDSVRRRVMADVPLGVFLSGGIDSSAVTAAMARMNNQAGPTPQPIKTFCVGFADGHDERPYAKMVADRYGTDHHELHVDTTVAEAFPLVMDYFDEPFADSSSIPTYLVSKAAREHVTVVLTGDGGDELFAGYDAYLNQKYQFGGKLTSKVGRLVGPRLTAAGLGALADRFYPRFSTRWQHDHWQRIRSTVPPNEMASWLGAGRPNIAKFYADHRWLDVSDRDPLSVAFSFDLNHYLPDDLLKKVDMAAMLASLECRAPFLDPRLVEFSLRIPPPLKLRGDHLKYVLKKALEPHLPHEVLYRSKLGFGAPIMRWINGSLGELARDLIHPGCRVEEFFQPAQVRAVSRRAFAGDETDYRTAHQIWTIIVFEWWLRKYRP